MKWHVSSSSYVRPVVAGKTYHDALGVEFEYGERWGIERPPAGSYSVDSHPERFAPLHGIADALIEHLQSTYDVEVTDDLSFAPISYVRFRRAVRSG